MWDKTESIMQEQDNNGNPIHSGRKQGKGCNAHGPPLKLIMSLTISSRDGARLSCKHHEIGEWN